MSKIESRAFVRSLSEDKFQKRPMYLLYGSEPKLLLDASKLLYRQLKDIAGADNSFHYLSVGSGNEDISFAEIVSQLNTVSMFGGGKAVLIGPMKKPLKDGMKTLEEYAMNPNPDSFFVVSIVMDAKGLNDFEKSSFAKSVINGGVAIRFGSMNAGEVKKWVKERVSFKGFSIGNIAIERLVELGDKDVNRLGGEIEKLFAYMGEEKEITLDIVEEVASDHRESMVWDFTDAVSMRNFPVAVTILNNLMEHNQPLQMILKMLTGEVIRLASAKGYKNRGESFQAYSAGMGGSMFPLKKAWANAGRWRDDDFVRALRGVREAYMDSMMGGASVQTSLNRLVAGLPIKPSLSQRG